MRASIMCAILVAIFLGIWINATHLKEPPPLAQEDWDNGYWDTYLEKNSPEDAIRKFQSALELTPGSLKHDYGHVFGGALYKTLGISAIAYCGFDETHGCMHEFVGQALAEHGVDIAHDLHKACQDVIPHNPIGCEHGMGHAILAALGYQGEDLSEALDLCRASPNIQDAKQCFGGVFMEYNMRSMTSDVTNRRKLDETTPFAPCDTFSGLAAESCYRWLPQWWRNELPHPKTSTTTFTVMSSWCRSLSDPIFQDRCFFGLYKKVTSGSLDNTAAAKELCKLTSTSPRELSLCYAYGALGFWETLQPEKALAMCSEEIAIRQEFCLLYARGEANDVTLPDPSLIELLL